MYQVFNYIKFLLKSTNQHGVHSPFVYSFVTKCLYDNTKYSDYRILKSYRKQLLDSDKSIHVTDFGAGSKKMHPAKRHVSKMLKHSSSPYKDTKLLFRISKYFQFQNTLELGTSLGVGTQALALGHPENTVTTIEGCPETYNFVTEQFDIQKLTNVITVNSDFERAISELQNKHFDCIFFDGHHEKNATIRYFNILKGKTHNDTVFIFDDIYWSSGMTKAWEQIIKDKSVSVSIDTFNLGFVFFRKEQLKQHFRIRL